MNIFVLDLDPSIAAQVQCDKYVVKMVLETTQLLCSVYSNDTAPYKRMHYKHPSEMYVVYKWLIRLMLKLKLLS